MNGCFLKNYTLFLLAIKNNPRYSINFYDILFMHKIFLQALVWNSSTSFLYKIALLLHQISLYSAISSTMYGLQSTLFALIYTTIALTNFGFEETLLPFFSTYTQNKQQFLQTWLHFIGHTITATILAVVFYITLAYGSGAFLHNLQIHCNKNIIFLCAMVFLIESLKKSLIAMMQLAFLSKQIAYAGIIALCVYIMSVWGLYNVHQTLTLFDIFMPMFITSTVELGYLLYIFRGFYQQLPEITRSTKISFAIIGTQRIYNYVHQIEKALYSPNSMTIFFAYFLGFQQAATVKFFTNIITLSYTCISKSMSVTSGAVFSAMKQLPLHDVRKFFAEVTHKYVQMLIILSAIILCIVGYAYYVAVITGIMAAQIILFFSINFLEYVCVTYEQLLISQGASYLLALIDFIALTTLIICACLYKACFINQMLLLTIFIGIKLITLWVIIFLAHQQWKKQ